MFPYVARATTSFETHSLAAASSSSRVENECGGGDEGGNAGGTEVAFMLLDAFEYTRNEVSAATVGSGCDCCRLLI